MTHRERLERKLELRQEWADKRREKARALFKRAEPFRGDIAFNTQPGHIPLRARIIAAQDRGFENMEVANHHDQCAKGIERALDKSIFSDDSDAIDALVARIAEREAERARMALVNRLYRSRKQEQLADLGLSLESLDQQIAAQASYHKKQPYQSWELSNLGGRIQADRKRLEYLKVQQERRQKAEQTTCGVVIEAIHSEYSSGYCTVTFAEKPDRAVLNALRGAGFHWGGGSWSGKLDKLPEEVKAILNYREQDPE